MAVTQLTSASKLKSWYTTINSIITEVGSKQNSNTAVTHTANTSVGGVATPVYVASNGVVSACSYTLSASVPSGAKFTDTTYSAATTSNDGLMTSAMVTKLNSIASSATKVTSATVASWGFKTTDNNTVTTVASSSGTGNAITNVTANNGALTLVYGSTFLTEHQDISGKANLASPVFTGSPTAPTQSATDSSTKIATTAFVKQAFAAVDAIVYKGTVVPTATAPGVYTVAANKGDLYKATAAGYVNGVKVEAGDMLICNTDSTAAATSSNYTTVKANWDIVQTNTEVFTGATASANGTVGLVPAPTSGNQAKFLRADGTWQTPSNTDTKVTQTVTTASGAYPILMKNTTSSATVTEAARFGSAFTINPGTGEMSVPSLVVASSITISGSITSTDSSTKAATTAFVQDAVSAIETYTVFTGATSAADGTSGLVPVPTSGNQSKFLRGDGTWATVSTTDTKVTQTVTTASGEYPLLVKNTVSSATVTDTARFAAGFTLNPGTGTMTVPSVNYSVNSVSTATNTITAASKEFTAITCSTAATSITFTPAAATVYARKIIRLTASVDTVLSVTGAVWANAEEAPQWGTKDYHLLFEALFVGGSVILHVLDNDQEYANVSALAEA